MHFKTLNRITHLPVWAHAAAAIGTTAFFQWAKGKLDASYAASLHPMDYATGQTTFNGVQIKEYYAPCSKQGHWMSTSQRNWSILALSRRSRVWDFSFAHSSPVLDAIPVWADVSAFLQGCPSSLPPPAMQSKTGFRLSCSPIQQASPIGWHSPIRPSQAPSSRSSRSACSWCWSPYSASSQGACSKCHASAEHWIFRHRVRSSAVPKGADQGYATASAPPISTPLRAQPTPSRHDDLCPQA